MDSYTGLSMGSKQTGRAGEELVFYMTGTVTKAVLDSLKFNVRKKAVCDLQRIAEAITEDYTAFGVFRPDGEDRLLLDKLEDILQLLEESYPDLIE